jgi:exosome complex RNA-binding protein Rrp4
MFTYHTTVPASEMKQMARMAVPSSHMTAATMMAMVIRKERAERPCTGDHVAGRIVSVQPCQLCVS